MKNTICKIGAFLLPAFGVACLCAVVFGLGTCSNPEGEVSGKIGAGFVCLVFSAVVFGLGVAWYAASLEAYESCQRWWDERDRK